MTGEEVDKLKVGSLLANIKTGYVFRVDDISADGRMLDFLLTSVAKGTDNWLFATWLMKEDWVLIDAG